jgi:hypothetical protein
MVLKNGMVYIVQYGMVFNVNNMKQGDKVTCNTHPGEWTLVWYKEGDNTCAIQNDRMRCIVKVSTLKPVK